MLGMPLRSPGALVRQAEELCHVLHIMCGKLLEHLLAFHALSECDNNISV
jgi:hypothetical protein